MKRIILFCILLFYINNLYATEKIKEYIECSNIVYKNVAYKLFKLETGNFTSNLFKKANNIAGIKYNTKGCCIGKYNSYAKYTYIQDSVDDYNRIEKKIIRKYRVKNSKQFIQALCKYGYAKDCNYLTKLLKI